MRILALLNGSTAGYSGGDLHTIAVLNEWVGTHEVTLMLPSGSSQEIRALVDPRVAIVGNTKPGKPLGRARLLVRYSARLIRSCVIVLWQGKRWDVVVASSHYAFDLVPTALVRNSKCRRLVYWHHHAVRLTPRPRVLRALGRASERAALFLVSQPGWVVLTSNPGTRAYLLGRGLSPSRVRLTHNGSSLRRPNSPDQKVAEYIRELEPGVKVVVFCGRLSRLKGTRDLGRIARGVTESPYDAIVVAIGHDGDGAVELRNTLANSIAAGRVILPGFVDDEEKTALFFRAHVVVSLSYEEGWSITVGDGLAAGCWVVAYDLPAVRAAFPVGPRYVPVGDKEAFLSEVLWALGAPRPNGIAMEENWQAIAESDLKAICRL